MISLNEISLAELCDKAVDISGGGSLIHLILLQHLRNQLFPIGAFFQKLPKESAALGQLDDTGKINRSGANRNHDVGTGNFLQYKVVFYLHMITIKIISYHDSFCKYQMDFSTKEIRKRSQKPFETNEHDIMAYYLDIYLQYEFIRGCTICKR